MLGLHFLIFVDFLGTCKITQIKFGSLDHAILIYFLTFQEELENGVRSRRVDIHLSLTSDPISFASFQKSKTIILICYDIFTKALHINSLHSVFPDTESILLFSVLKEIKYFFVVDLDEGAIYGNARLILSYLIE